MQEIYCHLHELAVRFFEREYVEVIHDVGRLLLVPLPGCALQTEQITGGRLACRCCGPCRSCDGLFERRRLRKLQASTPLAMGNCSPPPLEAKTAALGPCSTNQAFSAAQALKNSSQALLHAELDTCLGPKRIHDTGRPSSNNNSCPWNVASSSKSAYA